MNNQTLNHDDDCNIHVDGGDCTCHAWARATYPESQFPCSDPPLVRGAAHRNDCDCEVCAASFWA